MRTTKEWEEEQRREEKNIYIFLYRRSTHDLVLARLTLLSYSLVQKNIF